MHTNKYSTLYSLKPLKCNIAWSWYHCLMFFCNLNCTNIKFLSPRSTLILNTWAATIQTGVHKMRKKEASPRQQAPIIYKGLSYLLLSTCSHIMSFILPYHVSSTGMWSRGGCRDKWWFLIHKIKARGGPVTYATCFLYLLNIFSKNSPDPLKILTQNQENIDQDWEDNAASHQGQGCPGYLTLKWGKNTFKGQLRNDVTQRNLKCTWNSLK